MALEGLMVVFRPQMSERLSDQREYVKIVASLALSGICIVTSVILRVTTLLINTSIWFKIASHQQPNKAYWF
jgi:hypothetical protein